MTTDASEKTRDVAKRLQQQQQIEKFYVAKEASYWSNVTHPFLLLQSLKSILQRTQFYT